MKFLKNSQVFQFFHSNYVKASDFIKNNKDANDFARWMVNTAVNGFLVSVSISALLGFQWSPLLLVGSGFAHYMVFDMLAQGASIIKRPYKNG
jgi:hypothetical protein